MAIEWTTPTTLNGGASLVTTELDSLASGSESASFTVSNGSGRKLYAKVRVDLGSITPTNQAITLRLYGPNADAPASSRSTDVGLGSYYTATGTVNSSASAKVVEFMRVPIDPYNMKATIENSTGVALNAADNDVFVEVYSETDV